MLSRRETETPPTIKTSGFSLQKEMEAYEVRLIRNALIQTGGVQKDAAKLLGVKPTTLNVKIKRYKLNRQRIDF